MVDEIIIPQTYRPSIPPLELVHLVTDKELGRKLMEISEKTPKEIIDEYGFESEILKAALLYPTTMWGINPEVPGVGFFLPLYLVRMLNAALIKGGSHRLTSAIYKSLIADNGTVEDTLEVDKIIMEDKRAVGVRTTDGREFRAKSVISTVDPPQTFLRFVGEDALNDLSPGLVATIKGWQWEEVSHWVLHLIMDRQPEFKAAGYDPDVSNAFIQVMGVESMNDVVDKFRAAEKGRPSLWGHLTNFTRFDISQKASMLARFLPEN